MANWTDYSTKSLYIENAKREGWSVSNFNDNPAFPCYVLIEPSGKLHRPQTWDEGLTEAQAWSMLPDGIDGAA